MSDAIRETISRFTEKLREQERAVAKTKEMINALHEELGESAPYKSIPTTEQASEVIAPGVFFGKPFATAAEMLFRLKGKPLTAQDIVIGLKAGGFDFAGRDHEQSVRTSLGKNSAKFAAIPHSDMFGLVEMFPGIAKRRNKKKANGDSNEIADNQSGEQATDDSDGNTSEG